MPLVDFSMCFILLGNAVAERAPLLPVPMAMPPLVSVRASSNGQLLTLVLVLLILIFLRLSDASLLGASSLRLLLLRDDIMPKAILE